MEALQLEYLSRDEINFLAQIAGIKGLYGIPLEPQVSDEKENLQSPKNSLIEKGVLLPSYSLSDNAKFLINALEQYANATKYVHFSHLLIGIIDNLDTACVITTLEKDAKYRIQILEKKHILYNVCQSFSIFSRTPHENELSFATKEIDEVRLKQIQAINISNVELFEIDVISKEGRKLILYFVDEEDIIRWDYNTKKFSIASSFFLNYELCDALNIEILDKEEA